MASEIIPFNFDEIYQAVADKFIEKGYDAPYEGSNLAQLITGMSYITSMLNVNTAANVSEMLLTKARKRINVLQDARMLGYEIQHRISFQYDLRLSFQAGSHTIKKYTRFESNGLSYYYFGDEIYLEAVPEGYEITLRVKEGNLFRYEEYPETLVTRTTMVTDEKGNEYEQYMIDVPYVDVEETGLEVYCSYFDEDAFFNDKVEFKRTDHFIVDLDTEFQKHFMRIDDVKYRTPRIYFKYAGVGEGIRIGTTVFVNVLVSSGEYGVLSDIPTTSELACECLSYEVKVQGTEEESIDEIKQNAPLFHNTANRAVTVGDFTVITNRHNTVKIAKVWDGNDEYPKIKGHIWFSMLPSIYSRSFTANSTNTEYSLNLAEDDVNNFMEPVETGEKTSPVHIPDENSVFANISKYSLPTLIFHNRNPFYIDCSYTINIVKYDVRSTKSEINDGVFNVIDEYFLSDLEKFDVEYFNSSLVKRVDATLTDSTGLNISVTNKIMISKMNIHPEDLDNLDIKSVNIPLGVPFETYISGDRLVTGVLPQIDTVDFIGSTDLRVDWDSATGTIDDPIIKYDIYFGATIVGEYQYINGFTKYINVLLNIGGALTEAMFETPKYLNINYVSPNFKLVKNVIPRLRDVKFI